MTARAWSKILLVIMVSCSTPKSSALQQADTLFSQERYVEAEALYRQQFSLLENKSTGIVLLQRLALLNSVYLHHPEQAASDYTLIAKLKPLSTEAFAAKKELGRLYKNELHKPDAAVKIYHTILDEFAHRPEIREIHLTMVQTLVEMGDFEQAHTEAVAMLQRWPLAPEVLQAGFYGAQALYLQNRSEEAVQMYRDLLSRHPEPTLQASIQFEMGNCYQELGELQKALEYYQASLADHSNPRIVQNKITHTTSRLRRQVRVPFVFEGATNTGSQPKKI
jgi:tetratricopeptide (TPR) repeat protein